MHSHTYMCDSSLLCCSSGWLRAPYIDQAPSHLPSARIEDLYHHACPSGLLCASCRLIRIIILLNASYLPCVLCLCINNGKFSSVLKQTTDRPEDYFQKFQKR